MATESTLFLDAHYSIEKESDQSVLFFHFDVGDSLILILSQGLFLVAACLVLPDAELNRLLKSPVHLWWDLLPSFIGLGAVLPTFSRNRGHKHMAFAKAQWAGLCEDRD